ncbi:MAG: flagellar hook-length control protein FliK [Deltaproteobacteria bacterium]|nr:flagellar hook-length control protein FliK [Deltaproteobacteria bacterium]
MFREITKANNLLSGFKSGKGHRGAPFRAGEIFTGRVIKGLRGGEFLVSARGNRFRAHARIALAEGRSYRFQVRCAGPRVELKVVTPGPDRPLNLLSGRISGGASRKRLPALLREIVAARDWKGISPSLREGLVELNRLLASVIFKGSGNVGVSWFAEYLFRSGLFWEGKVARLLLEGRKIDRNKLLQGDLKGILLRLEKDLNVLEGWSKETKDLALKIREALRFIEQDQFLNLASIKEAGGWFLFLPIMGERDFHGGELLVKEPKGEDGIIRFHLSLEFSELGPMEVSVSILGGILDARILAADERRLKILQDNLSLLEKGLRKKGLQPGTLSCGIRGEEDAGRVSTEQTRGSTPGVDLSV